MKWLELTLWSMRKVTQVNVMHWLLNQSANIINTLEEELREDYSVLLLVNLLMLTRMEP